VKTVLRKLVKPFKRRQNTAAAQRGPVIERIEVARINLRNRGTPHARLVSIRLHRIKQQITQINRDILATQKELQKHHGINTPTAGAFRASHAITISLLRANKIRLAAQAQRIIRDEKV
jgi:hypothetical protein